MEALALPLLALVAGVVSFSSPCCLPLLPGYLSYVSALPVSELGDRDARRVTVGASLLFVAGFTTVFTIFGIGATLVGSLFLRNQDTVVRVSGVVIIAMGLSTMGVLRVPALMRERRVDLNRVPRGPAFAFPMGMAFAAGWAPCIGPVLATILATAAATGTVAWGAVLLIVYSVGLGIPFVLLALGFSRAQRSLDWLRRNGRRIEVAGGALLVAVGILFVTGRWMTMFRPLQLVRPAGLAADMTVPERRIAIDMGVLDRRRRPGNAVWLLAAAVAVVAVAAVTASPGGGDGERGASPSAGFVGGDLHSLVDDPTTPGRLFVGGHDAVSTFSDGGRTWSRVESLDGADAMGWAFTTDAVYVSGHPGIGRSSDGAAAFRPANDGLPDTDVHAFGAGRSTLGAASSADGGKTWEELALPAGATLVEADPNDPAVLYAGVHDGETVRVMVSRDGGARWERP